jgi:hypothetical protein
MLARSELFGGGRQKSSYFIEEELIYRMILSLEAPNYWRNAFKCAWM